MTCDIAGLVIITDVF